MKLGCVLMASGDSVRFEGDKLLAEFCGAPLCAWSFRAVQGLFQRAVVVTRAAGIADIARGMGLDCVLHDLPDVSDTIRLGVLAMDGMDGCLFSVCDQPLLARGSVERIIEAFAARPDAIVRARFGDDFGNPVLFPAALFPALAALEKGQTGGAVIRSHRQLVLPVDVGAAEELLDIDTREQMDALRQRAKANHRQSI